MKPEAGLSRVAKSRVVQRARRGRQPIDRPVSIGWSDPRWQEQLERIESRYRDLAQTLDEVESTLLTKVEQIFPAQQAASSENDSDSPSTDTLRRSKPR